MTSNNFTEAVTQSNPMERCPKSAQQTHRKTPTPMYKSSESQQTIILKSGTIPRIHHIPLKHAPYEYIGVDASDLYDLLDIGCITSFYTKRNT